MTTFEAGAVGGDRVVVVDDRVGVVVGTADGGVGRVGRRATERGELGHVAAHVVAVGVEARALHGRVEDAVRVGVGAGPGDPLPVEVVVGDVAVEQVIEEVARTGAPVDVQVLGEERRHDHAGAVVHEALARELAHAGVDDRVAGAALLPRGERARVVVPAIASRPVVGPRGVGTGGEDLVEEVAPAQLPEERVAHPASRRRHA